MKIRYALWNTQNRQGELEFLCCTQANWTSSFKQIRQEYEDNIEEYKEYNDGEIPDLRILKLDISEISK